MIERRTRTGADQTSRLIAERFWGGRAEEYDGLAFRIEPRVIVVVRRRDAQPSNTTVL